MTSDPAINPYDAVAYPGHSFSQTHPSRLATIAHFHGMAPALPSAMRVLELGCGRGGNLIPMAAQYPDSRFLGIDLSGDSIRQASAEDDGRAALRARAEDRLHRRGQPIEAATKVGWKRRHLSFQIGSWCCPNHVGSHHRPDRCDCLHPRPVQRLS